MDDTKPKLNLKTLTPDQRDKLEAYNHTQTQLRTMQDIADISQEMLSVLDATKLDDDKNDKQIGALLMDMRDSLTALNDKEDPETVDYAKPVVEAVTRLENALAKAIKAIDVKPTVKVDAPQVNVSPPSVDLKGIEKLLKTDMPKAFEAAIKLIPQPNKPDNSELLAVWEGISEQLLSIETATRLKPLPGSMKVTNMDGSAIGGSGGLTDTQLRASAVPVSVASIPSHPVTNAGTFAVQVTSAPTTAVTGPLTDTQLRATAVPVSGTVSTGGLTDTQLRATAVPVSGTVTMSNPTAQGLTDTQLRATAVPISLATAPTTPVTGTFFQTTQPVSATALPLPAGAATSANQQTNALTDAQLRATAVPVSGTVSTGGLTDTQLRATAVPVTANAGTNLNTSLLATAAKQDTLLAEMLLKADLTDTQPVSLASVPTHGVTGTFFQATQPVSAAALPLPTGAATSANQQTNALTDAQLRLTPVPVSGTVTTTGLTDTQLRATAVPISVASLPSHAVTNAGTFAVQVTSAPTTAVTGTFFQTTQPTTDANKQAVIFYAQILNATTTITPTAGKRIKLVKAQVLQSPDNTAANPVTLSFVSTGNFSTGWAYSDSCEATGALNEVLNITLGNSQSVSVNIRYKEI